MDFKVCREKKHVNNFRGNGAAVSVLKHPRLVLSQIFILIEDGEFFSDVKQILYEKGCSMERRL